MYQTSEKCCIVEDEVQGEDYGQVLSSLGFIVLLTGQL